MVLSALYLIYVISLGSSTMIGDEIGGDPGGMVLPLFLAIFMFIASAALFVTDKKSSSAGGKKMGSQEKHLFAMTVVAALLYVVLARPLGYLLTTLALLYTLTFFYRRADVRAADLGTWIVGLVASTALLLGLYSIGRSITRTLLLSARRGAIPALFGSPSTVVAIVLVVVGALFIIALVLARRTMAATRCSETVRASVNSALIAVATVELIYLIFRQLFLVELVRGIINW